MKELHDWEEWMKDKLDDQEIVFQESHWEAAQKMIDAAEEKSPKGGFTFWRRGFFALFLLAIIGVLIIKNEGIKNERIATTSPTIAENKKEIENNSTAISESKKGIKKNSLTISENKKEIENNLPAISENKKGIEKNSPAVSESKKGIENNAAAIAESKKGIEKNSPTVSESKKGVENNKNDYEGLQPFVTLPETPKSPSPFERSKTLETAKNTSENNKNNYEGLASSPSATQPFVTLPETPKSPSPFERSKTLETVKNTSENNKNNYEGLASTPSVTQPFVTLAEKPKSFLPFERLKTLETATPTLPFEQSKTLETASNTLPKKFHHSPFHVDVFAGVSAEPKLNALSPTVGCRASYFVSKKIAFQLFSNYFVSKNLADNVKEIKQTEYGLGFSTTTYSFKAKALHYAELGTGLIIPLGRQEVFGGISYIRLFKVISELETSESNSFGLQSRNIQPIVGYTQGLQKSDISISLGYGWYVSRKLQLRISGNMGLKDLTDNSYFGNSIFNRNQQLRVGLAWKIY